MHAACKLNIEPAVGLTEVEHRSLEVCGSQQLGKGRAGTSRIVAGCAHYRTEAECRSERRVGRCEEGQGLTRVGESTRKASSIDCRSEESLHVRQMRAVSCKWGIHAYT